MHVKNGMRQEILIVVVVLLSIVGVFKPKIGLAAYTVFGLTRPDVLSYSHGDFPYSLLLAAGAGIGSIRELGGASVLLQTPITLGLVSLYATLAASSYFALDPAASMSALNLFTRTVLMCLLIPILIRTYEDLKKFILVVALSLGVVGVKFGLGGIISGGGQYTGGIGGFMDDNNTLAVGFVMVLPMCWYAREAVEGRWTRGLLTLCSVMTVMAIIMSFSRGAAIALACVLVMISLRSGRKMMALILLAFLLVPAFFLVGHSYVDRLSTLRNPSEESSAASRLRQNEIAWELWKERPWTGVGFGGKNYMRVTEEPVVIHNTYLQILVDSGLFACLTFSSLLLFTICWLGHTCNPDRTPPEYLWLPRALQTALVGFGIDAVFHPRCTFDFTYMLLMASACWYVIWRRELAGSVEFSDDETPTSVTSAAL